MSEQGHPDQWQNHKSGLLYRVVNQDGVWVLECGGWGDASRWNPGLDVYAAAARIATLAAEVARLRSIVDQEIGSALDRAEKAVLNRDAGFRAGAEADGAVAEALDQFSGMCLLIPPGPDSGSLCKIYGDQDLWFAAMDALARYRTARDTQGEQNG